MLVWAIAPKETGYRTPVHCVLYGEKYDNKSLAKTPCIANILTLESLCAEHFMQKLERELCQKYLDEHKPKLDLQDFASV